MGPRGQKVRLDTFNFATPVHTAAGGYCVFGHVTWCCVLFILNNLYTSTAFVTVISFSKRSDISWVSRNNLLQRRSSRIVQNLHFEAVSLNSKAIAVTIPFFCSLLIYCCYIFKIIPLYLWNKIHDYLYKYLRLYIYLKNNFLFNFFYSFV